MTEQPETMPPRRDDPRPDVNDPKTVDRLTRAAIRILRQNAPQSSRLSWWKRSKK